MSAIAIASGGSALTPATGNINLFVATTGSDSNPGTALLPFRTIQHALNVSLGFDYQGLYFPTINVANGTYAETLEIFQPIFSIDSSSHRAGFLTGNTGTPANVLIAPTSGADISILDIRGNWQINGFGLVCDQTVAGFDQPVININETLCSVRNIDINNGTVFGYNTWVTASNHASLSGGGTWTIHGTGPLNSNALSVLSQSTAFFSATFTFTSAINLGGGGFFDVESVSEADVRFTNFVTPGNVTAGTPVFMLTGSELNMGGVDPATGPPNGGNWPSGPFDPTQIDGSCAIDGFFYPHKFSGAPVDQSSIYRGSWQIHKDSNQTTAGIGLNLYVDDAGTVVPLIALTPAPGNLTFFVSTTGSDSNPGTSGSPFRTIQHAVSFALSFDYQSLYTCTVNVANGTYHESPIVLGLFNAVNPTTITSIPFSIIGNTGTPTNCIIAPNAGSSASVISFLNGNFKFDGFSLVADTTSAGSDALLEITNEATVTIPTGMDFNMPLAAASLYSFGVRSSLWSRFAASSSSMTFQGTGWNGSNGIMNGIKWSNVSIGAATLTFNSAINMGGSPVFQGLFDAAIQFNSSGSVPTFVNPGNVTGMPPISLISGSQSLIGVDPVTITWPGGTFDPTQIDGSSNIDGFFYGIQNAGQLVDESTIYRGSWRAFKDTTNVRRYLAYDDGGTIYAKQIGRVPNTQAGTPYVLALSDQDGRVEMNNAGANQLTVPANATVAFPIGTEIRVVQVGAGATTIAGAVGVTVDAAGVVGGQWKSVMLYKRGTNEWVQTNV